MQAEKQFSGVALLDTNVNNFNLKNRFDTGEVNIDFSSCINSIDLPYFEFNNFIQSCKCPIAKLLKHQCKAIKYNPNSLTDKSIYEMKVVDTKDNYVKLKIEAIIKYTSGFKINLDKNIIFKYKHKDAKELQFYLLGNKVLFIDLYHLGIEGKNYGEKIYDKGMASKVKYQKVSIYKTNINEIGIFN